MAVTMIMRGMTEGAARGAARTLGWLNALMAAGMGLVGGAFVLGSLACGGIADSGYPMDREDSLAVAALFKANGFRISAMRSASDVNPDGRVSGLNLTGEGVKVLPAAIGDLDALEALYLGENEIKAVPAELEKLVSLATLDLRDNEIESLPDGLRFESLRQADLGGNRLTALPSNFDVTSVERLDLGGNLLASLPPDFRYLMKLTHLDLEGNRLENLDVDFSLLTKLTSLDLSHNLLRSLPPSLAGLDPAFLDVGNNRLCFHLLADADSATLELIDWLDEKDRDWRTTQTCP